MTDNIVTIKGNQYKYKYIDGETKYLGPVSSSPPLSEEEFLREMKKWYSWRVEDDVDVRHVDGIDVGVLLNKLKLNIRLFDIYGRGKYKWLTEPVEGEGIFVQMEDGRPQQSFFVDKHSGRLTNISYNFTGDKSSNWSQSIRVYNEEQLAAMWDPGTKALIFTKEEIEAALKENNHRLLVGEYKNLMENPMDAPYFKCVKKK